MLHVPEVDMRQYAIVCFNNYKKCQTCHILFLSTLGMDRFKELFECYLEFEDDLSNPEAYPMAVFWNSYLEMVQTPCEIVKSIKTGDWDLYMYASEKMLHWFHAHNNYNYACHFSYYWASQQAFVWDHPSIFQHFKEGGFSTR